ncbi:MAG: hypothetical protein ACFE8O_06000 [Candidatus Hermodarchaeota archaeon]
MRKGILIILVCFPVCFLSLTQLSLNTNAQSSQSDINMGYPDLNWSYTFGTNDGHDAAYSVIQCSDGGYFITGSTMIEGTLDVIMIRLNETGELIWSKTLIREGEQIAQEVIECESGGHAIIGNTQEQLPNGTLLDSDAYLIRVHANGSVAWTQTIGTNASQQAYSIIEPYGGGFTFAGYTTNSERGDLDFWLVHTTPEGQLLWNRTYGSEGNDICYSLVEWGPYEGLVLVGSRYNVGSGDQEGWIINTHYDGTIQWARTYGGSRNVIFYDVIRRSNRVLVIVGAKENLLSGGLDAFILSVYEDGDFWWNTTIGGFFNQEAYSITICHDGGYAITGYTIEQTQFGTYTHLLVTRIDSSGTVEWNKRYGGAGVEIGWSIIQAPNDDFIIAGTTESNQGDEVGTDAWIISIPDAPYFDQSGPPNFELILLGIITGVIIITIASLIYFRSKRNLR